MVSKTAEKKNHMTEAIVAGLKNMIFPVVSIVLSIFIAVFFVMWAKGYGILDYFKALDDLFTIIWNGSFGDSRKSLVTLEYVTPLIFTGLANALAFKTGLFNVGVEGQFMLGMLSAGLIGLIPGLSPIIHIPLIIIGGMVAGGFWGSIPGYLKAKIGTNEVINTIMMNYIALSTLNFVILRTAFGIRAKAATPEIQLSAQLARFVPDWSRTNVGIIIGVVLAILVYFLLLKTTTGYELRAVGLNPYAAEYGGISISKNTILAMTISGAIAGLGGAVHVSGTQHQLQSGPGPGYGLSGIAVALLAKNNPIACVASAFLFGILDNSSKSLQLNGIPKEIVYLIQSVIIIFVSTDYIVKYFKEKRKKEAIANA